MAGSYEYLGELAAASGRPAEGVEHFREALSIIEDLAHNDPEDVQLRAEQAKLLMKLGRALADTDEHREARRRLESAEGLFETLSQEQPEKAKLRNGLADTRQELTELFARRDGS